jgi:hypothetical protein
MTRVPVRMLKSYLRMLPRLAAEESQRMAERIMVGTGSCDKDGIRSVTRRWAKEATAHRTKARALPPDKLTGFGIGYQVVTRG